MKTHPVKAIELRPGDIVFSRVDLWMSPASPSGFGTIMPVASSVLDLKILVPCRTAMMFFGWAGDVQEPNQFGSELFSTPKLLCMGSPCFFLPLKDHGFLDIFLVASDDDTIDP